MEFVKISRGATRAVYDEEQVNRILDSGFICHVACQVNGRVEMIPTAYGRKEDVIYIHGSTKNYTMNKILESNETCISVTHLDGLVLAKSLFDTSVNYRSLVIRGKAELVLDDKERMEGLKCITEQIIPGRWQEVPVGSAQELKATMIIKIKMEQVAAKIREGGPKGDEDKMESIWSGHIPLKMIAGQPQPDPKFDDRPEKTPSVIDFFKRHQ